MVMCFEDDRLATYQKLNIDIIKLKRLVVELSSIKNKT